jgi:hypothetical protein
MMRSANGIRADDPVGRFRSGWRAKAEEGSVEAAIEDGFRDGVNYGRVARSMAAENGSVKKP